MLRSNTSVSLHPTRVLAALARVPGGDSSHCGDRQPLFAGAGGGDGAADRDSKVHPGALALHAARPEARAPAGLLGRVLSCELCSEAPREGERARRERAFDLGPRYIYLGDIREVPFLCPGSIIPKVTRSTLWPLVRNI